MFPIQIIEFSIFFLITLFGVEVTQLFTVRWMDKQWNVYVYIQP